MDYQQKLVNYISINQNHDFIDFVNTNDIYLLETNCLYLSAAIFFNNQFIFNHILNENSISSENDRDILIKSIFKNANTNFLKYFFKNNFFQVEMNMKFIIPLFKREAEDQALYFLLNKYHSFFQSESIFLLGYNNAYIESLLKKINKVFQINKINKIQDF
jgi:hypothetical protein